MFTPVNIANDNSYHDASSKGHELSTPRSGDLSTIIESELSNVSMSKHIPPLDISEEHSRPHVVDITASESNSPDNENSEPEDDGEGLVLANLARQVHQRSVSILKSQDLNVSPSPTRSRGGNDSADLSASWPAGLADFRRSMGQRMNEIGVSSSGTSLSASPTPENLPPHSAPTQFLSVVSSQLTADDPELNEAQPSFDLSSLDPDLAALLSPNNLPAHRNDKDAAIFAAVQAVPPPPMSPSPSPEPTPEEEIDNADTGGQNMSASARASGESRRRSRTPVLGLQSSPPARKTRPTSYTHSSSSRSSADLQRPSESPTAKKSAFQTMSIKINGLKSQTVLPNSDVATSLSTSRHPMPERSNSALGGSSYSRDPAKRQALTRHLGTSRRPSTASGAYKPRIASDSRSILYRNQSAREPNRNADAADLITPTDRSVSVLGMASNSRRLLGASWTRREAGPTGDARSSRNRKRSMSVNESKSSVMRRVPDWMGPRTTRAFVAAGLLDLDRDHEEDRPRPSLSRNDYRPQSSLRPATADGTSERNFRAPSRTTTISTLYAPSRVSESRSSWDRRESISRAMTMAELNRGDSPVTTITSSTPTSGSNPRTAFSVSSATSLSGSSPNQPFHQVQVETVIQSLKDKHALETEALLSALADSQYTSRSLREENAQLKGRIQDLEEQISDLVEQLNVTRRSTPPFPAQSYAHVMLSRSRSGSRASSAETRPMWHSRMQSFVIASNTSVDDAEHSSDMPIINTDDNNLKTPTPSMGDPVINISPRLVAQLSEHNIRKRASTASSVFPVVPSNMSMLMHEENGGGESEGDTGSLGFHFPYPQSQSQSRANSPPPSPTLLLSRLTASASAPGVSRVARGRHTAKPSMSSIGSGASTSADMMSLFSVPGSPGSLRLKPEDEKHLGEMMSIDLSIAGDND